MVNLLLFNKIAEKKLVKPAVTTIVYIVLLIFTRNFCRSPAKYENITHPWGQWDLFDLVTKNAHIFKRNYAKCVIFIACFVPKKIVKSVDKIANQISDGK